MTEHNAKIHTKTALSSIWFIPLVAVLIGGWMLYENWRNQGTLIQLSFQTAEGIEAGKTVVKALSVTIGRVEQVVLKPNLNGVNVFIRINSQAKHLLASDSQFWVVKPRVDMKSISGLDTLVSGAYIELHPGKSDQQNSNFIGLEAPPITSASAQGIRLQLYSEQGSSLTVGSGITYHGFDVGRIEQVEFDSEENKMRYSIFVRAPFSDLVHENSRFWNTSGIDISSSSQGFNIRTGSIATLLSGGIAFDIPKGRTAGAAAQPNSRYALFNNYDAISKQDYSHFNEYLLEFNQSIRGLDAGAPVEFRGIRVGTVKGVSQSMLPDNLTDYNARIPVLIRIEPERLGIQNFSQSDNELQKWIKQGLRASLKSGNLLTGALYVNLDIYPETPPAELTSRAGFKIIPTVFGGFDQLQHKAFALLDKIDALPLVPLLTNANTIISNSQATLTQLNKTLQSLDNLLTDKNSRLLAKETRSTLKQVRLSMKTLSSDSPMYHELHNSLQKLRAVLTKLEPVIDTLNEKPSALIFDSPNRLDPIPRVSQ